MSRLIPDIVVGEGDCSSSLPLEVFEAQQSQFAKSIALNGDRIIYGVAGSGKTLMLEVKARTIRTIQPGKRILVVCHNKPLRHYFERKLGGLRIEITTIFSWYSAIINRWGNQELTDALSSEEKSLDFWEKAPLMIEAGLNLGKQLPLYDFILVDEGQDLEKLAFRHLKLAHKDGDQSLFLVFLDNLQAIHKRSENRFRWVDVGINATGRTRYLKKNYRNARKVGTYTQQIVEQLVKVSSDEERTDVTLLTEQFSRDGGTVIVDTWTRRDVNYNLIGTLLKIPQGMTVMIIYSGISRPKKLQKIQSGLKKWKYTKEVVLCDQIEIIPGEDQIPIYSVYRCKGLEADAVIFLRSGSEESEVAFVGNTRARELLYDITVTM